MSEGRGVGLRSACCVRQKVFVSLAGDIRGHLGGRSIGPRPAQHGESLSPDYGRMGTRWRTRGGGHGHLREPPRPGPVRIDATTRSEASLRVCCRRQLLASGHELDALATIAYLRADGVVADGLAPGDMEPQLRTARSILGCVDHLAEGLDYFEGS